MKKTLLLTLIFLPFLTPSFSQTSIDIFAGVNNSAFSNGLSSLSMFQKSSIHIGIGAEKKLSNTFSFRPQLMYSAQGNREIKEGVIQAKVNYLNLPLTFAFDSPYLILGPQIGYLIDSKFEKRFMKLIK